MWNPRESERTRAAPECKSASRGPRWLGPALGSDKGWMTVERCLSRLGDP